MRQCIFISSALLWLSKIHGFASPGKLWRMQRNSFRLLEESALQDGPTGMNAGTGTGTKLTDWVVENLESQGSSITSSSETKAGENDTIPLEGLCIANVRVLAADSSFIQTEGDAFHPIRLLVGRNGWGTGVHPSTRLCLEWICSDQTIQGGEVILDYGCGSGILSICALQLGASRAVGVDVEAEALVTAERNLELNNFGDRFEGLHTREIIPYCLCRPTGVDVCVANILIGQLVRPSMVSAIASNVAPNGYLCMSGIRPHEVVSLKSVYDETFEWLDDQYSELSAEDCPGSMESYGFDCGRWARLVGRRRQHDREADIERMSDLAIS
jgi:SAM-dependent methyltransferase